jgi:putative MATE family efflux protein
LAGLSLPRQVFALAIWPLLEQVLNLMVGVVDLALAGHLRPADLAVRATDALGVAGYVSWLMVIFQASVGVGSTALIARAIGGRRRAAANAVLGQSLLLAVAAGSVVAAVVFLLAPWFGRIAGLEEQTLPLCNAYLRILCVATPFSALLIAGNACLRGAGDTRTPFFVMIVVNLVNAGFSIALVYLPRPWGGWGVHGIAIGTLIAWIVGAGIVAATLARGRVDLRLYRRRLRPHAHTIRRIVRVGLPNLMESAGGMWLATFLVLTMVGRLPGVGLIGAHMIAIRVESFSFQSGFALSVAASTLAGQYLGLGDAARARQAVNLCWKAAAVIMGAMGAFFVVAPLPLARIMTDNAELLGHAAMPIRICGGVQAFFATGIVLSAALRGAGDTAMTMKLTYLSVFAVRVPLAFVLGHTLGYGLNGIWVALCLEISVRAALFTTRYLHGGWTRLRV